MVTINLDVVIDPTCPACYIAHKHLTTAIATFEHRYKGDTVVLQWLPLILQPNAIDTSMDLSTFIASRFGPAVRDSKLAWEKEMALVEGIKFNPNRKLGSSYDSQRFIHLAGEISPTLQSSVVQRIFAGHFEEGNCVASRPFLMKVASECGIRNDVAASWLGSNIGGPAVDEKVRQISERGIRAVPKILVPGNFMVEGNYSENALLALFERLRSDMTLKTMD